VTRENYTKALTSIHPLPVPRHARLNIAVEGPEQTGPHEPDIYLPGPETLASQAREGPQRPVMVGAGQRLSDATVPVVQVFAVVQYLFRMRVRGDELGREDGCRGVGHGNGVAEQRVEISRRDVVLAI
jgi:hypothetical protein